MDEPTRLEDYVDFLQRLGEADQDYFLVGGQAVNFWAEYISSKEPSNDLRRFLPFTSKDCDIWVSHAAAQHLETRGEGKLHKGQSPSDGQLGIFTTNGHP